VTLGHHDLIMNWHSMMCHGKSHCEMASYDMT